MILYEHFNTTNQTSPVYAAHDNYVTDIKDPDCSLVISFPYDKRCEFAKRTPGCSEDYQYINYIYFVFCTINARSSSVELLTIFFLLLLCCYMFIILGTIADKFFCPSLTFVSDKLGLSETLAGVTLLAFGNGASDVFTCFASLHKSDTGMLYSELMGAAGFVTGVVGGSIIIISPFKLFPAAFIRDACFLLLATLYIDLAIYTSILTVLESVVILLIYLAYIVVVFIDQYLVTKAANELKHELRRSLVPPSNDFLQRLTIANLEADADYESKRFHSIMSSVSSETLPVFNAPNKNLYEDFLEKIKPFEKEEWNESGIIGKIITILTLPIVFLLVCLIPIVEFGTNLNGWSKLLNTMQITLMPCVYLLTSPDFALEDIGIFFLILVLTIPISILVFVSTRTDTEPNFHVVFAIMGIVGSVICINIVANEVVSILTVIGIVVQASTSFLGCTLLAWGNSVGDLISNITLAKHGYQKMAFAACFGGPIFNVISGLGITFLYKTITGNHSQVSQGSMGKTCTVFVAMNLALLLLATFFTNYQARRSIGIFMLLAYLIFFFYTLCDLFGFIHPYGTDHREENHF